MRRLRDCVGVPNVQEWWLLSIPHRSLRWTEYIMYKCFLAIPSCMKWTLWGIINTLPYMRGGQERIKKKKGWGFFNSSGMKSRLTSREISLFFPPFGLIITGFSTVIDEKKLVGSFVHSNITILFTRKLFLSHAEREIGNKYAVI